MKLPQFLALLIPCIGGASFSLIGIAYRLGRPRGVRSEDVALVIGIAGAAFFAVRSGAGALLSAPPWTWALGLGLGGTQYALVKAVQGSLSFGPLSPVWCAVSLHFIPVILFARMAFGESLNGLQIAGVAAGIVCVFVGSAQQKADESPEVAGRHIRWPAYLGLLMIVFLTNSLPPASVKALGQVEVSAALTAMDAHGDAVYVGLYAALAAALAIDRLCSKGRRAPLRPWLLLGALGTAGSIGGMLSMAVCASLPAVMVFTAMSITSILVTSMVSVLFFKERTTLAWTAMVLTGVLAVLLVGAGRAKAEPPPRVGGTAVSDR